MFSEFRSENPDRGLGAKRARVTEAGAGTSPFRRGGTAGVYERPGRNDDYGGRLDGDDASAGGLDRRGVGTGDRYNRGELSTGDKYKRGDLGTGERLSREGGPF